MAADKPCAQLQPSLLLPHWIMFLKPVFEQNVVALVYYAMRQCRRVDDNEVSCKE